MDAKELRIGNWYERNDFSQHQITIDDLVYLSKGEEITRIHPIPLTEEWLLRFGFKAAKYPKGRCFYLNNFWISLSEKLNVYISDTSEEDDLSGITLNILHVHKLQNLFFALTGEELTYQL